MLTWLRRIVLIATHLTMVRGDRLRRTPLNWGWFPPHLISITPFVRSPVALTEAMPVVPVGEPDSILVVEVEPWTEGGSDEKPLPVCVGAEFLQRCGTHAIATGTRDNAAQPDEAVRNAPGVVVLVDLKCQKARTPMKLVCGGDRRAGVHG